MNTTLTNERIGIADRFRLWYEYERDCNQKIVDMLRSVPRDEVDSRAYRRAVDLFDHLLTARLIWLNRLGGCQAKPGEWFPKGAPLDELVEKQQEVERLWTDYLSQLDDEKVEGPISYTGHDGRTYEWKLEYLLTQLFGHAWYHRGQIALLADQAGGVTPDTDFIFWNVTAPTWDTPLPQ